MTIVQYYERVYIAVLEKLLILLFWPSERELLAMLWRCLQREFQLNFQLVWFYDTVLISCMKPKLGSYKRLFFCEIAREGKVALCPLFFSDCVLLRTIKLNSNCLVFSVEFVIYTRQVRRCFCIDCPSWTGLYFRCSLAWRSAGSFSQFPADNRAQNLTWRGKNRFIYRSYEPKILFTCTTYN